MESQKVSFFDEISKMMFSFGDSHEPNADTVRLVESITLKQLRAIVQEALKYSDGKNLRGRELVFLMRHNKYKMLRFVQHLKNRELKKSVSQALKSSVPIIEIDKEPRKDELMDFIEYIDETGEFTDTSQVDEVKQERVMRADKMSQMLDKKRYLDFTKARTVSFAGNKLVAWVDPKKEINFHPPSIVALTYLAYQTVAEITDCAILVRQDAKVERSGGGFGSYPTGVQFNSELRFGAGNSNLDWTGQPPLSVNDIKEVMRRLHSPQAGKLSFGGKFPEMHYMFAL